MKNRMKKAVESARAHWNAPVPSLPAIAELEAFELLATGRMKGMSPAQLLAAVGLEITPTTWLRCSPGDQKLIVQALKCRLWIAAALAELLVETNQKQQERIRTFLKTLVTVTQRDEINLNGHDAHYFKKLRLDHAASAASAFVPVIAGAKARLKSLKVGQSADEVLADTARELTSIVRRSPLQPDDVALEPADLDGLGRVRPPAIALKLAAYAFHFKPAEVRRRLRAGSADHES